MSKKELDPSVKRNMIIVGALVLSAVLISLFIISGDKPTPPNEQSYIPQGGTAIVNANTQPPEGYENLAKQEEIERAKLAAQNNESYLPTLSIPAATDVNKNAGGDMSPIDQKIDASKQEATQPKDTDAIRMERQALEAKQRADISRKMSAWAALSETWRYEPSVKGQEVIPTAAPVPSTPAPQPQPSPGQPSGRIIYQAGESIYATIDMAVNTDEPSVVFATVTSGKLKGSILLGAARLNPNETITIEFDKISIPGRPQTSFRGVVIDSSTGRAALTGKVNRKIFARYIMPIAASVASTYGDLLAKQGQTTTVVAGGVVTNSVMTPQQINDAAKAAGISAITGAISDNAKNSNPSVELPNKLSVEVKLMKDVILP